MYAYNLYYVQWIHVPSAKWAACTHSVPFELDSGRCESSCRSKCILAARMSDRSWDAIVGQHVKLKPNSNRSGTPDQRWLSVHRFSIKYETKFSINNLIINKNIFHLCTRLNAAMKAIVSITTSTSLLLSLLLYSLVPLSFLHFFSQCLCVLVLVKNHHSVRSSHECQHEFLISSQPRGVTWNDVMWCLTLHIMTCNFVETTVNVIYWLIFAMAYSSTTCHSIPFRFRFVLFGSLFKPI